MSYITKLSLYPITNLSDARFAAAAGISYVGFCFDPSSPQFILPIKAKEILDWISGSHAIGYFGAQEVDEVLALSELLNMDVVALENNLLPDELPAIGKPIIKVIDVSHKDVNFISNEIDAYQQYADGFELKGVLPTSVSLDFVKDICSKHKVFLNLTLGSAMSRETLLNLAPYALVLAGGNEEKTGLKEYDELNDLLTLFTL